MNFEQKYLKYKAKYLELKNDLIGAGIMDVNRILAIAEDNYKEIFTELHDEKLSGTINFKDESSIRKAHRNMALKVSPDKFSNIVNFSDTDREKAGIALQKLNSAKDKLIKNIENEQMLRKREIRLERERLETEAKKRQKRQILEGIIESVDTKERISREDIDRYINYRRNADTTIHIDTYVLEQIRFLVNHSDVSNGDDLNKLQDVAKSIISNYNHDRDGYNAFIGYAKLLIQNIDMYVYRKLLR
jgi:hypothetical protein